ARHIGRTIASTEMHSVGCWLFRAAACLVQNHGLHRDKLGGGQSAVHVRVSPQPVGILECRTMRSILKIIVIIVVGLTAAQSLRAQSPRARGKLDRKAVETKPGKKAPNTMINMELLTIGDGVGLKAREWQEILSKMDVTLTIRNGRSSEKPEVTERKAGGTLRTVM